MFNRCRHSDTSIICNLVASTSTNTNRIQRRNLQYQRFLHRRVSEYDFSNQRLRSDKYIHSTPREQVWALCSTVLCTKFRNDWTAETDVVEKQDFARFEFKMNLGQISYVAQHPWYFVVHCWVYALADNTHAVRDNFTDSMTILLLLQCQRSKILTSTSHGAIRYW